MRCLALFFLLSFAGLLPHASADMPAQPRPYKTAVGQSDEYVFVMMPGHCDDEPREVWMTKTEYRSLSDARTNEKNLHSAAEALLYELDPCGYADLRQGFSAASEGDGLLVRLPSHRWTITGPLEAPSGEKYPASGLYRNDGSTTPLWTVEWYAFGTDVSNDGRYLVRMGPWAGDPRQLAIAFYADGQLTQAYEIGELVADVNVLPHSVSHFFWRQKVQFDRAENRLSLSTLNDEAYIFDVTTGEVLLADRPELSTLNATVQKTDGSGLQLTSFETCAGPMFTYTTITAGRRARLALYGDEPKPGVVDGGVYTSHTIPFSEISSARRLRARDKSAGIWLVQRRDESALELILSKDTGFCGKTPEGNDAQFPASELRSITFEPAAGRLQ